MYLWVANIFINSVYANMSIEAMEEVKRRSTQMPLLYNYAIFAIVFTIVVELLIAWITRFKNYKLVFFTNLITQLFLQYVTLNLYSNPFIDLTVIIIILEVIILIMEYKIYENKIEDISKMKIFLFSFIANFTTYVVPMLVGYYTERIV